MQANEARGNAVLIAAAASLGLISTETEGGFGRQWRVTVKGLKAVKEGFL